MNSNNITNTTNINITNGNNPRRSACDRCRGHKLRCVRPSDGVVQAGSNRTTLPPCERCVRAGAECLRTIHARRASIRLNDYERSFSSSSLSPSGLYRRPADTTHTTAASGHAFRHSVGRAHSQFLNSTNQPEENRSAVGPHSRNQVDSSHVPSRLREHSTSFEPNAANAAAAMSASIPMSMAAAVASHSALEPSISLDLGSFDLEMQNFHPTPDQELESDVGLAQLFGPSASVMAASTRPDTAGTGSKSAELDQDVTVNQPTRGRDECLGQLSALSSELLKCFSKIGDHPVALEDILAYSTPAKAYSGSGLAKNIIGMLLESSQVFLETLEHLESLTSLQDEQLQPCSPSNSEYSYVDSPDEAEFFSSESAVGTHTPAPAYGMHDNVNESDRTTAHYIEARSDQASSVPATAPTTFSPGHRQHGSFSLPAAFTIMTCYMWLLQGYEVVFTAIQNSLLAQRQQHQQQEEGQSQPQQLLQWQDGLRDDQTQKTSRAPPLSAHDSRTMKTDTKRSGPLVLPNIQFGGFGLDSYPNLQIEMLIHVSCQMIQKIEAILGIDTVGTGSDASAPSPDREHSPSGLRCAPALLYTYLQGGDSPQPGRSAIVKGMIKTIRQILNSEHS